MSPISRRWSVEAMFFGIKAAVLAIVMTALWRLTGGILRHMLLVMITTGILCRHFVFGVPFPLLFSGAAVTALLCRVSRADGEADGDDPSDEIRVIDRRVAGRGAPSRQCARAAMICAILWLAPSSFLYGWLGAGHIYGSRACSSARLRW